MNIRHLYIFKAVCEEMNFTRAAEKLYMTQPAVSHVINDLEVVLLEQLINIALAIDDFTFYLNKGD